MEIIPGLTITVGAVMNVMVEISFVMLCVLALIMVRQESLMDKVVSYSIGGSLKTLVWGALRALHANYCYSDYGVSNALGINFFRYINESGANGWCQVFARLPFDDTELMEKGALFGVVSGENREKWGDMEAEVTDWVETFFNGEDRKEGMAIFFGKFREKFPELGAVWLWITMGEAREVKMVMTEKVGLVLHRGGKKIDFGQMARNRVIAGKIQNGDVYYLKTEKMGYEESAWEDEVKETDLARCGMKIEMGRVEESEEMETQEAVPVIEEKKTELLVTDRYVGRVGWRERLRNYISEKTPHFAKASRDKQNNVLLISGESKKKRWSLVVGGVFSVTLVISLVTGSLKMKRDREMEVWTSFEEPIEKRLSESLSLVGMNSVGAKKIVGEARQMFNQGKVPSEQNGYKDRVEVLDKKSIEVWSKVSGEKAGKMELILNLDLIRSGVEANRISLVDKSRILILGQTSGLVLSGDMESKEVKVVAGKGVGLGWSDSVSDGKKTMIMTRGGVSVVERPANVLSFDAAVVEPIAMARFGSNIYILERVNKEIFRYGVKEDGFGERVRWLKEGQVVRSVPVDIAIDVDVWVLGEGNQIERFRRGVREEFEFTGMDGQIKLIRVAVDQNGDKLALLGAESGTVVICNKTGLCNQQIKNERLKQARDLEYDEQGRLLVLFGGSVEVLN